MFPYFEQPTLTLGPVTLHAFGFLVGVGAFLGFWMLVRRTRGQGLDEDLASGFAQWMLIAGFLTAHWAAVVFSDPRGLWEDPLLALKIWEGISSFGGLVGGLAGGLWFLKYKQANRVWAYLDSVAYVFPFAWVFGRAGCALAHDHPGIHTSSWLAVRYPEGPRYDLGLLELFYTLLIAGLFLVLDRRRWPTGFYLGLFFTLYGPVRFLLDSLRVQEVQYFGLTLGQYGSMVATVAGLVTLIWMTRGQKATPAVAPNP